MFAPKIDLIVTIWSDRLGPKFGLNPKGCYRQSPHLKKVWHPSTFFLPMHCFTSSLGSLSFWKCIRKIRLWAKKSWGQQQSIVAKMVSILLSMNFKSGHKLQRKKEKAAGAGTPKHLFLRGYKTTLLLLLLNVYWLDFLLASSIMIKWVLRVPRDEAGIY